ncbi:MAG TPA: histidine phosphatase family protein [Acidimicrobiia bacterium]|jgi:phosphohistidine phosphatase|nr:histidine phosphatase family protein [Acidimicrobiia bacterium]
MTTLFVLRHAKSSWNNSSLADHDRPLAPRGERAAEALAAHVATIDPPPALVLCSTARRARDTLEPVRAQLPDSTAVLIEDELYGAGAPDLLDRLREVPEDTPSVLLVGHNPGLEDLVTGLGRAGDPNLIARVHNKFPTGALATLAFSGPWKGLGWGAATLEAFVVPADLQ